MTLPTAFQLFHCLLLWCGSVVALATAEASVSPAASSAPGRTHSVALDYRALDTSAGAPNWNVPAVFQSSPFRREPDLGGRKVVRGTLKFGDRSDHFVAFILDVSQGKLHLDQNRNQDLTDDSGGLYSCQPHFSADSSYCFNNVRLAFKTAAGVHPALLDLYFIGLGNNNQPSVFADRHYLWEGKLACEGQFWQVGLVDSLEGQIGTAEGGVLLLRPWSARNQDHPGQASPLDLFGFSTHLFFGGCAFRLNSAYVQQDKHPQYRLDFQPQPAELGRLRLTGRFIQRLVLTRESVQPLTVILDAPGPVATLPLGSYTNGRVSLKRGEVEASRLSDRFGRAPTVPCAPVVRSGGEAVLTTGGPLTNTVQVRRRGNFLVLDYQLLGAGGEAYEARGPHADPGFAVYRARKQIYSGKFEPG